MKYKFYLLSCASPDEGGGIYEYILENDIVTQGKYFPCDRPMYAISEGNLFHVIIRDMGNTHSGYFTLDHNLENSSEIKDTQGVVACHLDVDGNDFYIANYLSGNIVKNGVQIDTHTGFGPSSPRQDFPHTHFAKITPDKKQVFCCDLSLDTIFVYDRNLNLLQKAKVPAGYGLRHLVFSKDGKFVYTINELVPSISVFTYENGVLEYVDTTLLFSDSTIPKGGAIRISSDGTKLYASVRGDNYTVVLDVCGPMLSICQVEPSYGNGPRDIYLLGSDYLVSCNELSNNTVIFKLKNGKIEKKIQDIPTKGSLCCLEQ